MTRTAPRYLLAGLLLAGLSLLPLTAAHLPGGGTAADVGIEAPPTPVWEAATHGAALLGGLVPVLPRRGAQRARRTPAAAERRALAQVPMLRTRAQRWFGRRLLEGG